MEHVCVTRIIPVSDQILLLIFKDTQTEKHDAKYILHQLPDITPRSDPEGFKSFIRKNEHVISEWASNIKCDAPAPGENTVEVTLSAEEDEWREMEETCSDLKITVEQLAVALARFFVEPGAKEALDQWYAQIAKSED